MNTYMQAMRAPVTYLQYYIILVQIVFYLK